MEKYYQEAQQLFKFLLSMPESRRALCNELLSIAQQHYAATSQNMNLSRLVGWSKAMEEPGFQSPPKWARAAGLQMAFNRGYKLDSPGKIGLAMQILLDYQVFNTEEDALGLVLGNLPIAPEWVATAKQLTLEYARYRIARNIKLGRLPSSA